MTLTLLWTLLPIGLNVSVNQHYVLDRHAIRTFVQPCLTYALRSTDLTNKSLQSYCKELLSTVRYSCHLPTRSTSHYIFASKQVGGLGFSDPFRENNIQTIVQAMKMSSSDPLVSTITNRELRQTVRFAVQAEPTAVLSGAFLSNSPDPAITPNVGNSSI